MNTPSLEFSFLWLLLLCWLELPEVDLLNFSSYSGPQVSPCPHLSLPPLNLPPLNKNHSGGCPSTGRCCEQNCVRMQGHFAGGGWLQPVPSTEHVRPSVPESGGCHCECTSHPQCFSLNLFPLILSIYLRTILAFLSSLPLCLPILFFWAPISQSMLFHLPPP